MKKITVDYVSDQPKYINGREVFPPEAVPQKSRVMFLTLKKQRITTKPQIIIKMR
ncbi:MAG: hypothetical protein WCH01_09990 [Methylococcaceae bacterium]|jgi:hypothetical protein